MRIPSDASGEPHGRTLTVVPNKSQGAVFELVIRAEACSCQAHGHPASACLARLIPRLAPLFQI
jgi:hypothetical protein